MPLAVEDVFVQQCEESLRRGVVTARLTRLMTSVSLCDPTQKRYFDNETGYLGASRE